MERFDTRRFWAGQVDKILLLALLLVLGAVVLWLEGRPGAESTLIWAQQSFASVLGAILMLLTGKALGGARKENGNGQQDKRRNRSL